MAVKKNSKNNNSPSPIIVVIRVVVITTLFFVVLPMILLSFDDSQNYSKHNNIETKNTKPSLDLKKEQDQLENKGIGNPSCTEDVWECDNWGTCFSNGTQKRICAKTFDCLLVETSSPDTSRSCKFDINNLDPLEMYLEIVEKVKSAPNSIMTSSYDSGTAKVELLWEVSEGTFIQEIKTSIYIDEFGNYKSSKIVDVTIFRDHNLDGHPDYYWYDSWGYDLRFKKLDKNVQEFEGLVVIWAMGIDYFLENILMK